jgi:hypothetical protein
MLPILPGDDPLLFPAQGGSTSTLGGQTKTPRELGLSRGVIPRCVVNRATELLNQIRAAVCHAAAATSMSSRDPLLAATRRRIEFAAL